MPYGQRQLKMKNGKWKMENGKLWGCFLIAGLTRNLIRLFLYINTETQSNGVFSNYSLCVSVPLWLYLQEIADQARDEDNGDRHALRAEPVPECNSP